MSLGIAASVILSVIALIALLAWAIKGGDE